LLRRSVSDAGGFRCPACCRAVPKTGQVRFIVGEHLEIILPCFGRRRLVAGSVLCFLTGAGEYYRLGFWASKFTPAVDPEFECTFYTPYMSGNGGVTILLLPNGMTYYYFSDNGEFVWLDAVKETNRMRSHCLFPAHITGSGDDVGLRGRPRAFTPAIASGAAPGPTLPPATPTPR